MTPHKMALSFFCIIAAFCAPAETTISQILVNQRWPWSEKVDVDFVLTGDASDVDVTATWDGHATPYTLKTIASCPPGQHRVTWDPGESPFAKRTLTGFTVSVATRTYLVLDLVKGGFTYLSDVP